MSPYRELARKPEPRRLSHVVDPHVVDEVGFLVDQVSRELKEKFIEVSDNS